MGINRSIFVLFCIFLVCGSVVYKADTQSELNEKEEEIKNLTAEINTLETQIDSTEKQIKSLEDNLEFKQIELENANTRLINVQQEIDEKKELSESIMIFLQYEKNGNFLLNSLSGDEQNLVSFANYYLLLTSSIDILTELTENQAELNETITKIEQTQNDVEIEKNDLEKSKTSLEKQIETLNEKVDIVKQDIADLNRQLEYEALGADTDSTYVTDEEKIELMNNASIPAEEQPYADYIIYHESSWYYQAENPISGSYGLCQALPPSKMEEAGSDWKTNPQTQMNWCNMYAIERYGDWEQAYNFWYENHWW